VADVKQYDILLEINGKLWGSHDLGLRAGLNFPAELIRLLAGGEPRPLSARVPAPMRSLPAWITRGYGGIYNGRTDYSRISWPLSGDIWHALARPAALPGVLWDLVFCSQLWNRDWKPTVMEAVAMLRQARSAWQVAHTLSLTAPRCGSKSEPTSTYRNTVGVPSGFGLPDRCVPPVSAPTLAACPRVRIPTITRPGPVHV
jgi:hypothetical protein